MKRFTPRTWLSLCILGFGVVEIAQGFVKSYRGLLAARFFLGVFEAGIFPGSFYLISFWYKPEESQKRFAGYFCSVILASAFGGLLASAIAGLDGVRGMSNWRWIFILEGIVTILVGFAAFFFVADFPSDATWLSEAEKRFVLSKSQKHEIGSDDRITRRDLAVFFKDPKNYFGAIMYFCKCPQRGSPISCPSPAKGLVISCRCPGLLIRLFHTDYHQNTWVLGGADAAPFSPPLCRRPWTLHSRGVSIRSD